MRKVKEKDDILHLLNLSTALTNDCYMKQEVFNH